jgi:hypothetical protein
MTIMAKDQAFPELKNWGSTRAALHNYCKLLGAIRGAYSEPHPNWWHVSLRPYTSGLTTTKIPHPTNKEDHFSLSLDLRNHYVLLSFSNGNLHQYRLIDGLSVNELGNILIEELAAEKFQTRIAKEKYDNSEKNEYSIDDAEKYFSTLNQIVNVFQLFADGISGELSPIQLWPHHFDLSFEQFGKKRIPYEEEGESKEYKSQIAYGFAPPDDSFQEPYFYVNPFPFDANITKSPLSKGAYWFEKGWNGAVLPYSEISNNPEGENILKQYLLSAQKAELSLIE